MVLLNQRTYWETSPVRGTISTLGAGNASDGQSSTSMQLSTIRFNDSKTFMEARLAGVSQIESSNGDNTDNKKAGEEPMETQVTSPSIV